MVSLFLFVIRFFGTLLLLVLIWHFATLKYVNPYRFTFIFGKKGSGKNTYLTKIAYQHLAKGWRVYSNTEIPGCYMIDPDDIGKYMIPPESVVLLDEIGLIWHSRDHKTFPKHVIRWFKLQRHYHVKVYATSQDFDCDKVLRILADDMYLLCSKLRIFSYGKRILKYPDLVNTSGDGSEKRLGDQLKFDFLLWPGSRILTYIPRWVKYFDSFYIDPLQVKSWPIHEPEKVPRKFRSREYKKRLRLAADQANSPSIESDDGSALEVLQGSDTL